MIDIDKQGRGDYEDDSRIERHNQRPRENSPTDYTNVNSGRPSDGVTEHTRDTFHKILTGDNTMSNATSFASQVQLLQELKQYLSQFQERLDGVSNSYESQIAQLHQAGMMDETYYRYVDNELAQTKAMISRLIDHIGNSDIPTVEREIAFLEQKL